MVPNFSATFNSMTGVKKLSTRFPMFKFSGRSKMTFRCSVLVCRKNCPLAKCDSDQGSDSPQQEFNNVKILEKFLVETSVEVIDRGDPNYEFFSDENSKRNYFETPSSSELDSSRLGSNLNHQTSSLHLDHDAQTKKSIQLELPPEDNDDGATITVESEDQLCLSPSRLVLGFGILLVILLLALVASCMMWMRARSYSRRPKPILSPRPPPRVQLSPGTRVSSPMAASPTGSPQTTTTAIVSARPYFVAPRYIRVMH